MKTVFANSQVAHVWAQQNQPSGRNAATSLWFEGPTLYSYHTPIAHIPDSKYGRIALLTSNTYSVTTSGKHMPAAASAVHGRLIYRVPNLDTTPESLRNNVAYLEKHYLAMIDSLMRCPCDSLRVRDLEPGRDFRGIYKTQAHATIVGLASEIASFRQMFDVPGTALTPNESADIIIARRDRLRADPKRVARRAAAELERAQRAERQAAIVGKERAECLAKWHAGEPISRRVSCDKGGAMLRLSAKRGTVQTSWGAEVPIADAIRVLKLYRSIWWPGQPAWVVPAHFAGVIMGSFRLDRINADGSIEVGCHTIYASQINALSTRLGSL